MVKQQCVHIWDIATTSIPGIYRGQPCRVLLASCKRCAATTQYPSEIHLAFRPGRKPSGTSVWQRRTKTHNRPSEVVAIS